MDLTTAQRQSIKQWVDEGATLSQVQTRIKSEFGISLTFLDTRMLVQDLGVQVKDKPSPKPPPPPVAPKPPRAPATEDDLDEEDAEAAEVPPAGDGLIGGKVTVTLDRVVRAGAVVSGEVTFSDGTQAKWLLDQMGRLALDGANPNYRPSAPDIQEFQMQLRSLLQTRGY
jgi:hypothetical protein